LQTNRFGHIRNDDGNLDALEPPGPNGVCDGEEIRATAGEEDSEAKGPIF
jgi:hypothetical protein